MTKSDDTSSLSQSEQMADAVRRIQNMVNPPDAVEFAMTADGKPVVKGFSYHKNNGGLAPDEIVKASQVDPSNISQVAASQLAIINSYYQGVLAQARQSFLWAIIAAVVGLLFFIASVAFVLLNQPNNVSIVSLISGALVEVISGINFYLYGQTSDHLSSFHVRLDTTQRFLLANSVCEGLEGETKQQARADLVRAIYNVQLQDGSSRGNQRKA